jgi:CheY-like chemotaxis protein
MVPASPRARRSSARRRCSASRAGARTVLAAEDWRESIFAIQFLQEPRKSTENQISILPPVMEQASFWTVPSHHEIVFHICCEGYTEKDGLQVITDLMSHGEPKPRIIVMTTYESEGDVRRVLKAGAKGYLVKGADPGSYSKSCRRPILTAA